jgi:hypothetical protein
LIKSKQRIKQALIKNRKESWIKNKRKKINKMDVDLYYGYDFVISGDHCLIIYQIAL